MKIIEKLSNQSLRKTWLINNIKLESKGITNQKFSVNLDLYADKNRNITYKI